MGIVRVAALTVLFIAMVGSVHAQTPTSGVRKDARGKNVTVKFTGKYRDCIAAGIRMGYSRAAARDYCDKRKAAGWLK